MGKKIFLPSPVVEYLRQKQKQIEKQTGKKKYSLSIALTELLDEVEKAQDINIIWNTNYYLARIYVSNENLVRLRNLSTKYNCSYGRVLLSYILQKKKKEGIMGYFTR